MRAGGGQSMDQYLHVSGNLSGTSTQIIFGFKFLTLHAPVYTSHIRHLLSGDHHLGKQIKHLVY